MVTSVALKFMLYNNFKATHIAKCKYRHKLTKLVLTMQCKHGFLIISSCFQDLILYEPFSCLFVIMYQSFNKIFGLCILSFSLHSCVVAIAYQLYANSSCRYFPLFRLFSPRYGLDDNFRSPEDDGLPDKYLEAMTAISVNIPEGRYGTK